MRFVTNEGELVERVAVNGWPWGHGAHSIEWTTTPCIDCSGGRLLPEEKPYLANVYYDGPRCVDCAVAYRNRTYIACLITQPNERKRRAKNPRRAAARLAIPEERP